jgi:hypothetical protein
MFQKRPLYDIEDDIENYGELSWKESIMEKVYNIKHFPTLLLQKLEALPFGSMKLWGSVILLWITYLILSSGSMYGMWYGYQVHRELLELQKTHEMIEFYQDQKISQENHLSCLQSQLHRIAEGREVTLYFCKK